MGLSSLALRHLALPLVLRRDHRGSALKHWRFFERSQYWPLRQLQEYQWQKLNSLLTHAFNTVPYYRRVFDERGLTPNSFKDFDDLRKLPTLTRDLIRNHQQELFSTQFQRSELIEFATGGTTRRRMALFRDQESHNIKMGAAWRFEGYIGRRPCDKMCFVWPVHIDLDPNESSRARFKNRYLTREIMLYAGAASEETLEQFYRKATAFGPEYLKVFPNALDRFAEFIDAHRYQPPQVKAVMSTGETLHAYHKEKFLRLFGAPTYNMYGSREVGNTACECGRRRGLHISMETSFVEFVHSNVPVPDETEGEILNTDLTNYGFPLIRYAVEDYGCRMTETCSCGRSLSLMSAGVGRMLDRYVAPDGTKHSALALSATIAETGPVLGQIQYRQKSLTHFHLLVTNDPPVTDEIRAHIRSVMHRLISPQIEITIESVNELPREESGKIRYFICDLDQGPHDITDTPE